MTLNKAIKKKRAIKFNGRDNAIKLFNELHKLGLTWKDGSSYLKDLDKFLDNKTNLIFDDRTCFVPKSGQCVYIHEDDKDGEAGQGDFKVINFEDIKFGDLKMENVLHAMAEIRRGTSEIIDLERIEMLVKRFYETGETFTIKAGFDPTAPDLHLGHTVLIQKLATFQKHGGIVQFLIGDFTATIGDPTGKSVTRKILTEKEVIENSMSYQEQVFKILDKDKTDIVFNSTWLKELGASGIIALSSNSTVARMLERDDFSKRFTSNTPIALSEFMYPLLQGYDSVSLKSDIEIGGTDQKFNLLMGRTLQKAYNIGKQQAVVMMPILEGLDGVQKMSKSLNNYVGVDDKPFDMFGKIMSISDELMATYFKLLSSKSIKEIGSLTRQMVEENLNPMEVKKVLAKEIVDRFHGAGAGDLAEKEFHSVHSSNKTPTDIKEFSFEKGTWIAKALVETGLVKSSSEARRAINQNSVTFDNVKITDDKMNIETVGSFILQKGKKNFVKLLISE